MSQKIGAFILAAGLGTRLKPWTDHHPKALALVNGKSLLERNVTYLQNHGIVDLTINVHHFADQIINQIHINKGWGSNVSISDETNQVLETGGGLLKASSLLKEYEHFVVLNCDILTNLDLSTIIAQHIQNKALATLAVTERISSRQLLFTNNSELAGWQNTTTGEVKIPLKNYNIEQLKPLAFSGIHVISKEIFSKITFSGKFSMIDLYLDLCKTEKIMAYNHSQDIVLDVGKPEAIAQAELLFP